MHKKKRQIFATSACAFFNYARSCGVGRLLTLRGKSCCQRAQMLVNGLAWLCLFHQTTFKIQKYHSGLNPKSYFFSWKFLGLRGNNSLGISEEMHRGFPGNGDAPEGERGLI